MANAVAMLTTADNPFNPFEDWDSWQRFDEDNGYHSVSYLARVAKTSYDLSDDDNNRLIEDAIDEIIELNVTGNYKKVFEKV